MPQGMPIWETAHQNCEEFHRRYKEATMADETSFSHRLRKQNSFLEEGRPYGEIIARRILEKGLIRSESPSIVEVGGGLGDLANSAIPVFLEKYPNLIYSMVDISPALQKAQQRATSQYDGHVKHLTGNAEDLRKAVSGVNLLISNEMLADLTAIVDIPKDADEEGKHPFKDESKPWWQIAREYINKYRLQMPSENDYTIWRINYGAFRFLENLPSVLSDNGAAFLVEYGTDYTKRVGLRGHNEYSINVPHFIKVAECNGFSVETGSLDQLLGIDSSKEAVMPYHINVSLVAGKPLIDLMAQGQVGWGKIHAAQDQHFSDPENYTYLDIALTADEFAEFAKKQGWTMFDMKNLPLENVAKDASQFKFFVLRKV